MVVGARLRAISLFSGAGGLDLGFEAGGFGIAVALEMDRDSVATLQANRCWPVINRDIHQVTSRSILRRGGLRTGEADALIGGPPCQPFSKAAYWASGQTLRLDDPRAGTLEAYLRVLRDTQPRAFILENVEGIAYRGKVDALDLLRGTLDEINRDRGTRYALSIAKLNAADYGVPQLRERVFLVGSRDGIELRFPKPTHAPPEECGPVNLLRPHATAWDAIGDLQDDPDPRLRVGGKWADLLPSIPEGHNYLWHTDRGKGLPLFGWRRRYWTFLLKLAKAAPSWTIQAQPGPATGPFHWRNRQLSVRELCRLQTFPDGYAVRGGLRSAHAQLGNAVPSALAEILARSIRRGLLGEEVVEVGSSLLPAVRRPMPDPEPAAEVPERYRQLEGRHAAHPGTGKGYRAEARAAVG
jgi:DNA (cytosine-5)-methyltransferase 1